MGGDENEFFQKNLFILERAGEGQRKRKEETQANSRLSTEPNRHGTPLA